MHYGFVVQFGGLCHLKFSFPQIIVLFDIVAIGTRHSGWLLMVSHHGEQFVFYWYVEQSQVLISSNSHNSLVVSAILTWIVIQAWIVQINRVIWWYKLVFSLVTFISNSFFTCLLPIFSRIKCILVQGLEFQG